MEASVTVTPSKERYSYMLVDLMGSYELHAIGCRDIKRKTAKLPMKHDNNQEITGTSPEDAVADFFSDPGCEGWADQTEIFPCCRRAQ
jgi:hypothetical protein